MNGQLATELMERFAGLTGLTGKVQPRRYLWTDAFAVCNFLGLLRETGHSDYLQLAMRLVDQVHRILGRHRPDDQRSGWISGLSEEEGERHPTSGGLRIGKTMNERQASEPPDPQLEWDRDGQYFHYLTKWMHALNRVSGETGDDRCLQWAAELAIAAHRAFVQEVRPGGPKRMAWKMSIDLSRPLVDSMGQHDPLDGLVTSLELRVQDRLSPDQSAGLDAAIADFSRLCKHGRRATEDPLGIGGLLDDAFRFSALVSRGRGDQLDLLIQLLHDVLSSLHVFSQSSLLKLPADRRLAFRELGLSIGLHGLSTIIEAASRDAELASAANRLLPYRSLGGQIEQFWSRPVHQESRTWLEHREINMVMLATSLAPSGYLAL